MGWRIVSIPPRASPSERLLEFGPYTPSRRYFARHLNRDTISQGHLRVHIRMQVTYSLFAAWRAVVRSDE